MDLLGRIFGSGEDTELSSCFVAMELLALRRLLVGPDEPREVKRADRPGSAGRRTEE
jgi:hypothetical protein